MRICKHPILTARKLAILFCRLVWTLEWHPFLTHFLAQNQAQNLAQTLEVFTKPLCNFHNPSRPKPKPICSLCHLSVLDAGTRSVQRWTRPVLVSNVGCPLVWSPTTRGQQWLLRPLQLTGRPIPRLPALTTRPFLCSMPSTTFQT